jgi:phage shock protein A
MTDLFKKINDLVRATVHDFVDGLMPGQESAPDSPYLEGKAGDLRRRVDDALDEEETAERRINELSAHIAEIDALADEAVARGDEAQARTFIAQIRRLEGRRQQMQDELERHRAATAELIDQVNVLESLMAEARAREKRAPETAPPPEGRERVVPLDAAEAQPAEKKLRIRPLTPPEDMPEAEPDEDDIEADLARRRARLSKPEE